MVLLSSALTTVPAIEPKTVICTTLNQLIGHLWQDPHKSDPRLVLHYGDLTESTNVIRIIQQVQPDEIYNLLLPAVVTHALEHMRERVNAMGLLSRIYCISIKEIVRKLN